MADKLYNGKTVSIRFSAPGAAQLEGLAASNGMEVSDYIRHLVALDSAAKHKQFVVLASLFGSASTGATSSVHDGALPPLTASQFGALE